MLANLPTYLVLFLAFLVRALLLGDVLRLQLFPLPRQPHLIQSVLLLQPPFLLRLSKEANPQERERQSECVRAIRMYPVTELLTERVYALGDDWLTDL